MASDIKHDDGASAATPRPTITLCRYATSPGCFCGSPWANRLDALLTFSSTPFEYSTKMANNLTSPNGRIPYVLVDKEMIADSLFAYDELVKRGLAKTLDEGLSQKELALSRSVMALATTMVRYLEKERWIDNYAYSRDKMLETLWWPFRPALAYIIYRDAYKLLTSLELTVITQAQLDGLRDSALDALVAFLTDDDGKTKKYFLGGDKPTSVDACVTSIIVTPAAHKGWSPKFYEAVKKRPALVEYAEGIRKTWWPERKPLFENTAEET